MEKQLSIYNSIMHEREQSHAIPYLFQNAETAGREDTLYILLTDGIPFSQREDLALECGQILRTILVEEEPWPSQQLTDFLQKYPMRLFFIELRERLRVLVEHEVFTLKELHSLGMELTRNSQDPEEVKLGIILLGFQLHDLAQHIFKVLGYHSDYTIYVAESIRHSHFKQNTLIYDLLQNTVGYGRLAALFLIKPVNDQQRKWVLKEGIKSSFLSTIYVNVTLQKADIRKYLYENEVTRDNYPDIMYLLAYREPVEDETMSDEMLALIEKVVEKREFAHTFIEQAALVMIWLQIIDSWKQDYHLLDKQVDEKAPLSEYWENRFSKYESIIRTIEVFLNKPKWRHLVLKEMAAPKETDFLMINVLQFLEMKPEMKAFIPLLMRNPLGLNLLDMFLVHHTETYFHDVCEYLDQLLTEDLFRLPLKFVERDELESGDLLKVNLWLERLLKCMLAKDLFDEQWCINTIHYYHPKIRRLSLQVLKKYADEWEFEDEVEDALEELLAVEKNKKNIRLIRKLMRLDSEVEKEKKYLPVKEAITSVSPTDKKLLNTYIAGMRYHDLTIVEELIQKGKILQLVRESDNENDRFAIAITLENGYLLGYIPRVDNRVLATLLDSDEILYARFEAEDIDEDDALISIMLRKNTPILPEEKPPTSHNVVQFPKK